VPDNPAIEIPGLARSLAELRFAADLRACQHCGVREPADWRMLSYDTRWRVSAACPRCRSERVYVFRADGDLLGRRPDYLHLGGPEPSTVVTAAELAAEIERLAPDVTLDPAAARDGEGAQRNLARHERLRTALTELAKFIPPGADEVPALAGPQPGPAVPQPGPAVPQPGPVVPEADDPVVSQSGPAAPEAGSVPEGRSVVPEAGRSVGPRARPARYTRDWISGELTYWEPLGRQLPRIPAGPRPVPLPRAALERGQADAHHDWLRRGRTGAGRLVLAGVDLRPVQLWGKDLTASRWERVLAGQGDLRHAVLSEAELADVDLAQSALDEARLAGARLTRCTLDGSSLGLTRLDGAQLTDCSLERIHTDRSSWRGAMVVRARLGLADFKSSWLDGARFTDCDLRGAWFRPGASSIRGTSAGAVFERCDLRDADFAGRDLDGATFIGCRLRGAAGRPSGTAGWRVIDADFSAAGDGSDLGGADDLLEQLGRDYDPRMADRTIRYSTGNEHSPTDPWGRSELVVHAGGRARLDHFFSRGRPARAWTGQVDAAALDALGAALDEAGFPAVPGPGFLPPDSTVRRLVVEADGAARQASLGWHQTPSLPGYATVFDILDGVIRQLSGEAVPYKSTQPPIVASLQEA
jgi:uncharacterized protein YjbI with pentapeptide repeats